MTVKVKLNSELTKEKTERDRLMWKKKIDTELRLENIYIFQ